MVAVALRCRPCFYDLAHQYIYLYVFALLAAELEELSVLQKEVYVFAVLASVPVVADAPGSLRFAGASRGLRRGGLA